MKKRQIVRDVLLFLAVLGGMITYSLLVDLKSLKSLTFLKNSRVYILLFFSSLTVGAWLLVLLLRKIGGKRIFFALIGLLAGRFASEVIDIVFIPKIPNKTSDFLIILDVFCIATALFLSLRFARSIIAKSTFPFLGFDTGRKTDVHARPKVVDTSVVIDGRIADVMDAGFIEGVFIVPEFVLTELQQIADSPDAIKRSRGRRGLDILNRMKTSPNCSIVITDLDFPAIPEVDAKLVELALRSNAMLLTNDFNLNKIAVLKGIRVLNINELANALKSSVLPGEEMTVTVIKEGKDPNQGIAYLDDGTMIVVDKGRGHINQRISVMVTSVFQTPAGRMIFAHPIK
jgi:uncharacterized protein YacL